MKVPVLIPARNEAEHIGATLEALPAEAEPFVIPNGCTDDTAAIAARYDHVTVLEGSPEGKLPALQFGIRHLGERAVEPFVTLDADTRPQFPDRWLAAMLKARAELDPERPAFVTGPFIYGDLSPLEALIRNGAQRLCLLKSQQDPQVSISGTNILFDLQDQMTVDRMLELPHIWVEEEKAMRDVVLERGGHVAKTIRRPAMVVTNCNDRFFGVLEELKHSPETNNQRLLEAYLAEAAPGSMTYWEFKAGVEAAA